MNVVIGYLLLWYIVGFLSCVIGTLYEDKYITLGWLIKFIFAGLLGPIISIIVFYLYVKDLMNSDKVIIDFRKKTTIEAPHEG